MEKKFLPIVFEFKMLNKHYILNNITLVNLYCGMERGGRGLVVGLLPEPLRLDTWTRKRLRYIVNSAAEIRDSRMQN